MRNPIPLGTKGACEDGRGAEELLRPVRTDYTGGARSTQCSNYAVVISSPLELGPCKRGGKIVYRAVYTGGLQVADRPPARQGGTARRARARSMDDAYNIERSLIQLLREAGKYNLCYRSTLPRNARFQDVSNP
jgi:hypothetical protein